LRSRFARLTLFSLLSLLDHRLLVEYADHFQSDDTRSHDGDVAQDQ